jgi:hypothetical protein
VDVTGNITAKLCEVWSEFNIFYTKLCRSCHGNKKKGGFKKFFDFFHQTS